VPTWEEIEALYAPAPVDQPDPLAAAFPPPYADVYGGLAPAAPEAVPLPAPELVPPPDAPINPTDPGLVPAPPALEPGSEANPLDMGVEDLSAPDEAPPAPAGPYSIDAVSGADPAALDPQAPYPVDVVSGGDPAAPDPRPYGERFVSFIDELAAEDPIAAGDFLAQLPPQYRAIYETSKAQRAADDVRQRLDEERRVADELVQQEYGTTKAKIDARANRLMTEIDRDSNLIKTDIDTGRYARSMPGWAMVLTALAAGFDGVQQLYHGGPNHTLQRLDAFIEQDIAAQKAEINAGIRKNEAQRGMLGRLHSMSNDLDQAAHTMRVGLYRAAGEKVAQQMATVDPQGTLARAYAQQLVEIQGRESEAMAAAREAASKRAEATLKAELSLRKDAREERKLRLDEGEFARKGAGGGGGVGVPVLKAGQPDTALPIYQKLYPHLKPKDIDPLTIQRVQERTATVNGVVAFMPSLTKENVAKTQVAIVDGEKAAVQFKRFIEMYRKHGWELSTGRVSTTKGRQMFADYRDLQLLWKSPAFANLGVLNGPDLDVLDEAFGGDPTQIRIGDGTLKIMEGKLGKLEEGVNSWLKTGNAVDINLEPVRFSAPLPDPKLLQQPRVEDLILRTQKLIGQENWEDAGLSARDLEATLMRGGGRSISVKDRDALGALLFELEKVPEESRRGKAIDKYPGVPGGTVEAVGRRTADVQGAYDPLERLEKIIKRGTPVEQEYTRENIPTSDLEVRDPSEGPGKKAPIVFVEPKKDAKKPKKKKEKTVDEEFAPTVRDWADEMFKEK
jgi:hypothetical protein